MPEKRTFVCITCPVGCEIEALVEGDQLLQIEGNACRRGIDFVKEELTDPKRMLASTVQVRGGKLPLVPVRSSAPLPKPLLLDVAERLRDVVLEAPVEIHQVAIHDVLGTGVDIVTTRPLSEA